MITSTLGSADYIIHHPNSVDIYSVTREQLELLLASSASEWKSYFQNALSVILTCLINILALGFDATSTSFRLNIGLGILSGIICTLCFFMKCRDENKQTTRLNEILAQPVQELNAHEEHITTI